MGVLTGLRFQAEHDDHDDAEHQSADAQRAFPGGDREPGKLQSLCAHPFHPFAMPCPSPPWRLPRSRKMARTKGGAAMNTTISAWITVTTSIGVDVCADITVPPACNAPNSRPAATVPHGLARPSNATVIA